MKKFGYRADIESFCDSHWDNGEEGYDNYREEHWSHSFKNIFRDDQNPDIASSLELTPGSKVLVVWLVYSSGDSFGTETGRWSNLVGIFTDSKSASQLEQAIYANAKTRNFTNDLEIITSDGQEFKIYPSWNGYFESLDYVSIEEVFLK